MKFSLDDHDDVKMTPLSRKQAEARIAAKQSLDGCMLRDVDLSHRDLSKISCRRAVFINVNLCGVNLEGANISQSLFQNCQMAGLRAQALFFFNLRWCNATSPPPRFAEAISKTPLLSAAVSRKQIFLTARCPGRCWLNARLRVHSFAVLRCSEPCSQKVILAMPISLPLI